MFQEIIQQNFTAIVTTLLLVLFITSSGNFDIKVNKHFLSATSCILALLALEIIEHLCMPDIELKVFRKILASVIHSIRPAIMYIMIMILCRKNDKRSIYFFNVLLIISVVTSFLSIIFNFGFSYNASKELVRGPLALVPIVVSAIFMLLLLILTLKKYKHSSSKEYLLTIAIAVMFVLGLIFELLLGYRYIITSCYAIAVTFYYLFFLTSTDNHDILTGALVRRRFYLDAEKFSETLTAVVALDLNDLKIWNDKHGHDAGDLALATMAEVVSSVLPKKSFLYRTGGDEFMILCNQLSATELMDLIANIRSAMSKTDYTCAIGYAFYHGSVGIDKLCLLADDMMYKDKIAIKGPEYAAKYTRLTTRANER
ncbi:MAG: GGDEF domain-containing protein [Lachnospiraceae bacterium]|nr:GGDEF domain-containing protein [Lachnospiraceae bacterium]